MYIRNTTSSREGPLILIASFFPQLTVAAAAVAVIISYCNVLPEGRLQEDRASGFREEAYKDLQGGPQLNRKDLRTERNRSQEHRQAKRIQVGSSAARERYCIG